MTVQCPYCKIHLQLKPKLASGYVRTSKGLNVSGTLDEATVSVKPSPPSSYDGNLSAYYELEGQAYTIVECIECRKEFVFSRWDPPSQVIAPLPDPSVPEELPAPVREAMIHAKKAHFVGAEIAAIMAGRTALTRMLRDSGASKFKDLVDQGKLTPLLYAQADEVRGWANLLAHADVPEDAASREDAELLLAYLDFVFDAIYVQPKKLEVLRANRPNAK